jgi:hypothetical protein
MKSATLLLTALFVFGGQPTLKADYGSLGLAYLFGYGGYGNLGFRSFGPSPPYFALHPPVYYGQRYSRPYGASPFAAWPQLQANPAYAPQPQVNRGQTIANPYCCGGPDTSTAAALPAIVHLPPAKPLEFDNPYYQPDDQPEARYTAK